jgi:hypothetical protein
MKNLFALALLLFAACSRAPRPPAFPAPEKTPSLQALVSTDKPRIGDPLDVHIRVNADTAPLLPPWEDLLHPELRLLSQDKQDGVTHLRVGVYSVTNITLFAEAKTRSLDEPPLDLGLPFLTLDVQSVLTEENPVPKFGNDALPDFRGPEALRRYRRNLLISILVFVALAALIAYISWRASRRPKPPPPPPDFARIALRAMDALRLTDVWLQPDPDASAVRLSSILRDYIERRFRIHAPELTTDEFLLAAAAHHPWPDDDQLRLEGFFRAVDRIKFAAERPGRKTLDDLMRAAEAFVRGTPSGGPA